MKFEWEAIHTHKSELSMGSTRRAKVHGGWIVHTIILIAQIPRDSTLFIPDPSHEWVINE